MVQNLEGTVPDGGIGGSERGTKGRFRRELNQNSREPNARGEDVRVV